MVHRSYIELYLKFIDKNVKIQQNCHNIRLCEIRDRTFIFFTVIHIDIMIKTKENQIFYYLCLLIMPFAVINIYRIFKHFPVIYKYF